MPAVTGLEWVLPSGSAGQEPARKAGDRGGMGSASGWGRPPGGGNGNPFQYSCLENPLDRGAWWAPVHGVTESWIRLSVLAREEGLVSWEMEALNESQGYRMPGCGIC